MKKNLGLVILIVLLVMIGLFIVFIIISKQNTGKQSFNIKSGDVITFNDYDTEVTILHVASTLCKNKDKCFDEGEVEVSMKVSFNDESYNYTLKSKTNPSVRIKNSNNYLLLFYRNEKIIVEIKNKTEL